MIVIKETKELRCPYCGSHAPLRKGSDLFGPNAKTAKVYVCENYPACDAYVTADIKGRPLGTLANKKLREMRVQAHRSFDRLWRSGYMTREWAYRWLGIRLEISSERCHIGKFSEKRCQQTVQICDEAWKKREEEKKIC